MPKIILKTGGTQDGEYDLDLSHFTWRERAFITEVSGTLPPEYIKKWFESDPMTIVATLGVMMQREGMIPNLELIMDAEDTAITIDYSDLIPDEAEDDASPPDEASPPSENGSDEKNDDAETGG